MRWLETENPDGKKIPRWQRTTGLSDTGEIFVPAAMAGDEEKVQMCALYDSTKSVAYLNHIYVPLKWMEQEYPDTKELCRIVELYIKSLG